MRSRSNVWIARIIAPMIRRLGLPQSYRYSEASWFSTLGAERERYIRVYLQAMFAVALIMPVAFTIDDLVLNVFSRIWYYLPAVLALIAGFLYIRLGGDLRIVEINSFLLLAVGYVAGAIMEAPRDSYILVFLCITPISFTLLGYRRGSVWIIAFGIIVAALGIVQHFAPFPYWNINLSNNQILMGYAGLILSAILLFSSERHSERTIARLLRSALFNDDTDLPNGEVLRLSIPQDKRTMLSIVRLANLADIGLLLGELERKRLHGRAAALIVGKLGNRATVFHLNERDFAVLQAIGPLEDPNGALSSLYKDIDSGLAGLLGGKLFRLSVRLGAYCGTDEAETCFRCAGQALRQAERFEEAFHLFRDQESWADPVVDTNIKFTILHRNLEESTLEAWFQPIVSMEDRSVAWYEALLRVKNPEGGHDSPMPYLAVAESLGFGAQLSDFILNEAARASSHLGKPVAINLTAQDLGRESFIQRAIDLQSRLWDAKGGEAGLIFEILERDRLENLMSHMKQLHRLRNAGIRIALDDFGSGYANFASLVVLPLDIVKIDGTLIRQTELAPGAHTLVSGIVSFCALSGLTTVAEHIDSEALEKSMRIMGLHYSQGFYYDQPRPLHHFEMQKNEIAR